MMIAAQERYTPHIPRLSAAMRHCHPSDAAEERYLSKERYLFSRTSTLMSYGANRPDRSGTHRRAFDRNRKIIYATQDVCGICGQPVDFSLKYPDPMSPCIDHIIPVAKGGHPSDMDNLQLAHWICNRIKSDKLPGTIRDTEADAEKETEEKAPEKTDLQGGLPWSIDWTAKTGA